MEPPTDPRPTPACAAAASSSPTAAALGPGVRRLFQIPAYRFQFGMRRGDTTWFDLAQSSPAALLERQRWLAERPSDCLVWEPDAAPALEATRLLFPGLHEPIRNLPPSASACARFSEHWEPDFLLLRRAPSGDYRLVGGAVCFPSAWRVTEKLGLEVTAIHDVVPTLNADLGDRIRRFLAQLKPGEVFERENWGLAAHGELNAHPDRSLPRLGPGAHPDRVWLRVEHQAFVGLPPGDALLFAIRLAVHPLSAVLADPEAARDFARMLASMPAGVAEYKGLAGARDALLRHLPSVEPAATP